MFIVNTLKTKIIFQKEQHYPHLTNNPIDNNLKGYPSVEPKIRYIEANIKKKKKNKIFQ